MISMSSKIKHASIFKGLVFAMLSGAFYSIVSMLVKQMRNLHPGQLALCGYIGTLVLVLPGTIKTGQNAFGPREYRVHIVVRGVFAGLFNFLNCIAFQFLGLGEASAIILSSPVVVTIFARVFFKEPCNIFQSITILFAVVGIVFTTKLPSRLTKEPVAYSDEQIYGLVAAVLSLFCLSAVHLITRKVRSVHQSIITFNYCWVGILITGFLTAVFGNFKWQYCGIQSLYILLLGLSYYSAITLVVMALQCEYAGPVCTVRAAVDIGLAFLWQIFIFYDVPDTYGIIGASLILVSIIFISLGKWLSSLDGNLFSCEKLK